MKIAPKPVKKLASGLAAGLSKGFVVKRREMPARLANMGRLSKSNALIREVMREDVGVAPCERRMSELMKIGSASTQKRSLKPATRRLGTHKRRKRKRDEMAEVVGAMRRKGH